MNRKTREANAARLRVGVGYALAVVAIYLCLAAASLPAHAASRYVFCANANNYTTSELIANATDEPVIYAPPSKIGPAPTFDIAAHSAQWFPCDAEFAFVAIDAAPSLVVGSKFRTPSQTVAIAPEFKPVTSAEYLGLLTGDGLESYVTVGVPKGQSGWVAVKDGLARAIVWLGDGESVLVPVFTETVTVTPGYDRIAPALPGPDFFLTFALIVHDATGALNVQQPAASTAPIEVP